MEKQSTYIISKAYGVSNPDGSEQYNAYPEGKMGMVPGCSY